MRSARRWGALQSRGPRLSRLAPPPVPCPSPGQGPPPGATLAAGGRRRGLPRRRKSLLPLPRQRARLVSLRSPGAGRAGLFHRGAVKSGLRALRPPASQRGLAGSGPRLQNALSGLGRGPVGERTQLQEERRNSGGNCECASAACFESGCATLGKSRALSVHPLVWIVSLCVYKRLVRILRCSSSVCYMWL